MGGVCDSFCRSFLFLVDIRLSNFFRALGRLRRNDVIYIFGALGITPLVIGYVALVKQPLTNLLANVFWHHPTDCTSPYHM